MVPKIFNASNFKSTACAFSHNFVSHFQLGNGKFVYSRTTVEQFTQEFTQVKNQNCFKEMSAAKSSKESETRRSSEIIEEFVKLVSK